MTSIKRTVFLLIPLLILSGAPQQAEARRRPILNALRAVGWVLFGGMAARRTLRNAKFCPECGARLCPTCGRHVNEHGTMGRNFAGNGNGFRNGGHNGRFPGGPGGPGQNPWVDPNNHGGGVNPPGGGGNVTGGGNTDNPPQPGGGQTGDGKDSGKKDGPTDTEEVKSASLKLNIGGKACQGTYVLREELPGDAQKPMCNFYIATTEECAKRLSTADKKLTAEPFSKEAGELKVADWFIEDGQGLIQVNDSCDRASIEPVDIGTHDNEELLAISNREGKILIGKKRETGDGDDPTYNLETTIDHEDQGAPIFNKKGEVIGIVNSPITPERDTSFSFKSKFKEFVAKAREDMKSKSQTQVVSGKSGMGTYSKAADDSDTSDKDVEEYTAGYGEPGGPIGPPAPKKYGEKGGLIGPPAPSSEPIYGPVRKRTANEALNNNALPQRPHLYQGAFGAPQRPNIDFKLEPDTSEAPESETSENKSTDPNGPVFVNGVLQPGFLKPVREVKTGGNASAPITMSPSQ